MARNRWRATTTALGVTGLLLLTGCSSIFGGQEPEPAIEVAEKLLSEHLSDETPVAGFEVAGSRLRVFSGDPVSSHLLYFGGLETEEPAQPLDDSPTWISASQFPVKESVDRIRQQFDDCRGEGRAEVWALTDSAVLTSVACLADDKVTRTSLLNDDLVPDIQDPFTKESVTQLWSEIEASGLDEIGLVSVDLTKGTRWVEFVGPDEDRTYGWSRELRGGLVSTSSTEGRPETTFSPSEHSIERVVAAFEQAMAQVDDPADVQSLEIRMDQGRVHLVLDGTNVDEPVSVEISPEQ